METTKKKYFAPINNFAALKEAEQKHYDSNEKNEIESFLNFWQWSYDKWRINNSPFEERFTEEKIRVRKELINKLGIKN